MQRKTPLHVTVEPKPDHHRQDLTLKGKLLGTPECYDMLEEIRERIEDGMTQVIMDMREVTMISSTGAGVLAATLTAANQKDGKLVLVGLNERCRQVLEFMHLNEFAAFVDTVADADIT